MISRKRKTIEPEDPAQGLSYNQARTALDLTIAQLQSEALEVEQMGDLYQRALIYADRCAEVLAQVEQEVIELDPCALGTMDQDA